MWQRLPRMVVARRFRATLPRLLVFLFCLVFTFREDTWTPLETRPRVVPNAQQAPYLDLFLFGTLLKEVIGPLLVGAAGAFGRRSREGVAKL